MERSTFERRLINSATDAAVMTVSSKEQPPDFQRRMIRVFMLGEERVKVQQRVVFQVLIADGCLFYGNDALRRRGGCCICLLMASGLIAKRFSIWLADASEGEFSYTIYSERLELAVFIILPRCVSTSHQCSNQSEMGDNRGGHANTKKDFLTYSVRHLSRLFVGKTNGEEIWNPKHRPQNCPTHLSWKNPTSSPKDSYETLMEKYKYLISQIPNEKLTQEEQKAFQDFENGNIDNVKSFMLYNKWTDQIDNMMKELPNLQQSEIILLQNKLTLLNDQLSSLSSSVASASSSQTAAATCSSSADSRKRRTDSLTSVKSKKSKTSISTHGNYIQNSSRNQGEILPEPTAQTAPEAYSIILAPVTVLPRSVGIESPVRHSFPSHLGSSLISSSSTMPNTCLDTLQCTTSPCHTETAAARNAQSSMEASPVGTIFTEGHPLHGGSHGDLPQNVSQKITLLSADSGTWSQESSFPMENWPIEIVQQKLNDTNVQDLLQSIHDSFIPPNQTESFDPSIFINFDAT